MDENLVYFTPDPMVCVNEPLPIVKGKEILRDMKGIKTNINPFKINIFNFKIKIESMGSSCRK